MIKMFKKNEVLGVFRAIAMPFFVLNKNLSQVYKQYVEILVTMAVPLLLLLLLNLRIIYAIRFQTLRCFHFLSPMSCLSRNQLWKYRTMEGNWPSFVCIQDTKHVEREARAVPHLPARLHRRRLPLLQQPQVFPRLLRQVSWCRCHEYNRILYLIIQVKQTLRNLECSDLGIKPRYFPDIYYI